MKFTIRMISVLLILSLLSSVSVFAQNTGIPVSELSDIENDGEITSDDSENTDEETEENEQFKTASFPDVLITDWFYEAVQYAYTNGVMIGIDTGEFAPESEMTRAMVVTVLARLAGADIDVIEDSGFEDVPVTSWHAKYIGWAKTNEIVKGMSETEFCPDNKVTREQVCVMLSNFLDLLNLSTANRPQPHFNDEAEISDWAIDAVLRLQYAGIVNGREDNNFDPKASTTRAEFAQIVYNSNLANIVK